MLTSVTFGVIGCTAVASSHFWAAACLCVMQQQVCVWCSIMIRLQTVCTCVAVELSAVKET